MRCLVTFGGAGYDHTIGKTLERALAVGVDRLPRSESPAVRVYDNVWLDAHPFRHLPGNEWLWKTDERRGYGWHAWKPMIVLDAFAYCQDGDVVLYLDGDTFPTGVSLAPLFDIAERDGACLFSYIGGDRQYVWCTGDCFVAMGQDTSNYRDARHGCARFGLWKKGDYKAFQFLCEWLTYCLNPMANARLAAYGTVYGRNSEGFREHRTDQAIYTNLAHKYEYSLRQEASSAGLDGPQYFEQGGSNAPDSEKGSRWRNV